MDVEQRIAQFEHMVGADPDNDMAHFSLGQAYVQAGRHEEAAASFLRCIELNEAMSKAYQLAGESLIEAGQTERAAEVLTKGYEAATKRGDRMPQQAMAEHLEKLGVPLPEVEVPDEPVVPEGTFVCKRTGRPGHQMDRPPFKGPVGQWIYENISKETFDDWIGQGTKVINELRLDLSRDEDEAIYDQHMREFLGIDEELHQELQSKAQG